MHHFLTPRTLFLVDSIGAGITLIFLNCVLAKYPLFFAVPVEVIQSLTLLAAVYCTYSISCFLLLSVNWKLQMKIICIANSLYCLLVLYWMLCYWDIIRWPGVVYFLIEIIILFVLAKVEWSVN